ncbi:MAG: DUF3108 domain-containing protein [Hydrogenophaga sp.]
MTQAFSPNPVRAAPTRTVLLGLTAAVLFAHWLTLGGSLPWWPSSASKTLSHIGALPTTAPSSADAMALSPATSAVTLPAPVTIATLRWIAPPPPPEPEPPIPEPPPPPKPVKTAQKSAVKPAPEPVIVTPLPDPLPDPLPIAPAAVALPAAEQPAEAPVLQSEPAANLASTPELVPETPPEALAAAQPTDNAGTGASSPPPPTSVVLVPNAALSYSVNGNAKGLTYHAGGSLTWQQNGATYKASLEISAFLLGTYTQNSVGLITPQGLAPERFAIKRRSGEKAAHFERSTGRIRYSRNAPDAPLLPDAQDQLSVTLQLGSLLNTYANLGGLRTVSLPVSSDGASEPWLFEVGDVALLKLPAGDVSARLLKRAPRRERDKTVELWLAPDLGHLPVRMRITEENGDFVDMLLKDLPALPPVATPAKDAVAVP